MSRKDMFVTDFSIVQNFTHQYDLRVSNRLYLTFLKKFSPEYRAIMDKYLSQGTIVDFSRTEITRQIINAAVEADTGGHIKDIIALGTYLFLIIVTVRRYWSVLFHCQLSVPSPTLSSVT